MTIRTRSKRALNTAIQMFEVGHSDEDVKRRLVRLFPKTPSDHLAEIVGAAKARMEIRPLDMREKNLMLRTRGRWWIRWLRAMGFGGFVSHVREV